MKKIRTLIIFAASTLCFVLSAAEADLLKLAQPADQILYINVTKLLGNPIFAKASDSFDSISGMIDPSLPDLSGTDISEVLTTVDSQRATAFIRFRQVAKLDQLLTANFNNLIPDERAGRRIYTLKANPETMLALLEPSLIAVTDKEKLPGLLGAAPNVMGPKVAAVLPPGDHVAWLVSMTSLKPLGINADNAVLTYDYTGDDNVDHEINAIIYCANAKQAQQNALMLPSMIQMFSGMVFGADPQLNADLIKNLKTGVENNALKLTLSINRELAERISEYLKKQASSVETAPTASGDAATKPAQAGGGDATTGATTKAY